MSFHHGYQYNKKTMEMWEPDLLAAVTPQIIERWMNTMVFGTADPGPDDMPTEGRSSTLEYSKKAVSFFMPNKLIGWNVMTNSGNPTRSIIVNDLIKSVKKLEVRRQGKPSQAKRASTTPEFRLSLRLWEGDGGFQSKYRWTTLKKLQFAIIGRVDDTCNLETRDLCGHGRYDFALSIKVKWSKNVLEERDCPDQALLGANDTDFCILLALSIYLETWMSSGRGRHSQYLFSDDPSELACKRTKANYMNQNRAIIARPEFQALLVRVKGSVGSHSDRKYPATFAKQNGRSTKEIECRGRWKTNNRKVVNRYIDPAQEFADTKVAAALCVGGAIKYKLVGNANVSKHWLHEYVVPGLIGFYGEDNGLADVLSLPLLWACLDPSMEERVDPVIRTRIREAYALVRRLDEGVNPVKKVQLTVYRIADQVCVDELQGVDGSDGGGAAGPTLQAAQNAEAVSEYTQQLLIQLNSLKQQVASMQHAVEASIGGVRTAMGQQFSVVNRNINRVAVQPALQRSRQTDGDHAAGAGGVLRTDSDLRIELSPHPRCLADLWTEYCHGIGGRKPARDFTHSERGRVKFKFCRRKAVWDVIGRLVNAGYSAPAAIQKIRRVYGEGLSVSLLIKAIVSDKSRGGHPNLRIGYMV
jgi:hypothetical protein